MLVRLDRYRQAAPQVYDRLRERIISLELAPGTPLSRVELAAQFGISQTPVRDALILLQQEGLVDVFPQAATEVSRIDIGRAEQAHFLRRAVELELVRELATGGDAALPKRLKAWVERQEAARKAEDFAAFAEADQMFHLELYRAAGQEELYNLVRSRSGHIDRLRRLHAPSPGKARRVVTEHMAILRAIKAHDPQGAQDGLRAHLSNTLANVDAIREAHPAFLTDG